MRKVEVFEPVKEDDKWTVRHKCVGLFHMFAQDHEVFESGPGNYPIAIVELEDGSILTPYVIHIRFMDKGE